MVHYWSMNHSCYIYNLSNCKSPPTLIDDYDELGHLMCSHPLHPFHYLEHLHHMIPHRHLDIKYERLQPYKYAIYDD